MISNAHRLTAALKHMNTIRRTLIRTPTAAVEASLTCRQDDYTLPVEWTIGEYTLQADYPTLAYQK